MNIWVPTREVTDEERDCITGTADRTEWGLYTETREISICGVPYRRVPLLGPVLLDVQAAEALCHE